VDDLYWAQLPRTLNTAEASTILKVGREAVLRRMKSGEIPAHRVGSAWIIFTVEFRAWLESRSNQPLQPSSKAPDLLAGYAETLTYQDLMKIFRRTKQTVGLWLRTGVIPAYNLQGRWVIHRSDVLRMLDETSNKS